MRHLRPVSYCFPLAVVACVFAVSACATSKPPEPAMGTITTMSAAKTANWVACPHKVPKEVCTRCNPHLIPKFKAANDWCPPHEVPESQCFECHPDLTFEPLPPVPEGADVKEISKLGEDVPNLEGHLAAGKVTLFDFYAVWCAPCRQIDAHVFALLRQRKDIAVRKLNVVDWDSPISKRYLKESAGLPYVLVYGKNGKRGKTVSGFDLKALDEAIAEASKP